MALRLIIPTNASSRDQIVTDYNSTATTDIAGEVRNDANIEFTIEPVLINPPGSVTLYTPDFETTDSFEFAWGLPDVLPTGGTFALSVDGYTTGLTALDFDITAADLQTALSAAFAAQGATGCTVTLLGDGAFAVIGTAKVALGSGWIVSSSNTLFPQSNVFIVDEDTGSATNYPQWLIIIRTSPMCLAEPSTLLPGTGVTVNETQAQTSSSNRIQSVDFDVEDTYGGAFSVDVTALGQTLTVGVARPSMSETEFAQLLNNHPSLHYNEPDETTNFAISKNGSSFVVSWIADLGPRYVNIASAAVANPVVIVTQTAHNFVQGDVITIAGTTGSTPSLNGSQTVTEVIDETSFTVAVNVTVAATENVGTAYDTEEPSIAATDIDLVGPTGVSGDIDANTIALYRYSRTVDTDTFEILASVTRTRAGGERRTIFGPATIVIAKEIVDTASMVPTPLPSYYTSAEVTTIIDAILDGTTPFSLAIIPSLAGSTAANGDIIIQGTTHATRTSSEVNIQPNGGDTYIGTAASGNNVNIGAEQFSVFTPTYTLGLYITDASFAIGDVGGSVNGTVIALNDTAATIGATATNGLLLNSSSAVKKFITATTTWDPGSLANNASEIKSGVSMPGVSLGDPVTAALNTINTSAWAIQATVVSTNTVDVRITNFTGGVVDLPSGTLRINAIKF